MRVEIQGGGGAVQKEIIDVHAFVTVLLSKIFRRKSIVVVGGYEVAKAQGI